MESIGFTKGLKFPRDGLLRPAVYGGPSMTEMTQELF